MTSLSLTLTTPDGTVARTIIPTIVRFQANISEVSTLEFLLESEWDTLYDETDTDNPCQLNGDVEFTRDGVMIFKGYIRDRELAQGGAGEQFIRVVAADPLGKCASTIASLGGEPLFTKATAYDVITNKAMIQLENAVGDALFPFYPTAGAGGDGDPWLLQLDGGQPVSPTSTLGTNIGNGTYAIASVNQGTKTFSVLANVAVEFEAGMQFEINGSTGNDDSGTDSGLWTVTSASWTGLQTEIIVVEAIPDTTADGNILNRTIKCGTTHGGILPCGLVQIDSEWIQYDGYDTSATNAYYKLKNCYRGAVGSSAAAHLAAATVYQRLSQKVHPALPIHVEGQLADDSWETIPGTSYQVQVEEGRIDFNYDVLDYPSGSTIYDHIRASYGVFDEDDGNQVELDTVVEDVLKATVANGGPGFGADDLDVDFNDQLGNPIRLTRIRVDEPMTTLDFIRNLLDELGLGKGTEQDAMVFWYDHENETVAGATITQKDPGSEDHVYNNVFQVVRDIPIDDLYSAVLMRYTSGVNENLVNLENIWVPSDGTTVGTNSVAIAGDVWQTEEEPLLNGWAKNKDDYTGNNVAEMRYMLDGLLGSGWGLYLDSDPGTGCDLIYIAFRNPAADVLVDSIEMVADARRKSDDTTPYNFSCLGIESFTIGNPVSDTKIAISGALTKRFSPGWTEQWNEVKMKADDLGVTLQGLCLRWDGLSRAIEDVWYALIKEIQVKGSIIKTVLIQLSDDATGDATKMYHPDSYNKLIDANHGQPRVKIIDVGQMSWDSAVTLGRLALLQSLVLEQTREYELQNFGPANVIPMVTETVKVTDYTSSGTFSGVVLGVEFTSNAGSEHLNLRVVDLEAGLL